MTNATAINPSALALQTATFDAPEPVADVEAFITRQEILGHYPTEIHAGRAFAAVDVDGSPFLANAKRYTSIVGTFADGHRECMGINGRSYDATTPKQWRDLLRAAANAGGRPTFGHSWDAKVIAAFDVQSKGGLKSSLVIGDSFDGSTKVIVGLSVNRPDCANQMAMLIKSGDWAKIKHTAGKDEKIARLTKGIEWAVKEGAAVSDLFDRAARVQLPAKAWHAAFDAFFPEAKENASAGATTRANNIREAAKIVGALPINRVGRPGNLATLWNAATFLVDRKADGNAATIRKGASPIESMLLGERGRKVEGFRHLVEVILADGRVEEMTTVEATNVGVDAATMGADILAAMIAEAN